MGKRAMQEVLLLDHQDRALSGKLGQMFMPLLQAALGKQLWEISTNRQEMSPHLRDLLEALREVDLARHSLREKEESARGSHEADERKEHRSNTHRPSKRKQPPPG